MNYEKTIEDLFIRDLEKDWKMSRQHFTTKEYQEVFGEEVLRQIAQENMSILSQQFKELDSKRRYLLSKYRGVLCGDEQDITEEIVDVLIRCLIEELIMSASKIIPYLFLHSKSQAQNSGFIDINVIIEKVLLSVYVEENYSSVRSLGDKLAMRCPFHDDKNPSLCVYKESESFYCFGCGKAGNVVNFVSFEQNLDFYEALKYLKNY
ncbi:hypothetical protein ISS03_00585 [Patescibacteria group bacterium]|nr:hypothetical protein [Patescibacteria group bacterium]